MARKSNSKPHARAAPSLSAMLDLARDSTIAGRRALFATVDDLFLEGESALSERERALMGDILRKLIGDVETAVRRELAERLAERGDMPRNLVIALANDEFDVAHALLVKSEVLKDVDLIEIIRDRSHAHQLAIATRKTVSEEVSQALADTGDVDVITTLLQNGDAEISRSLMAHLVLESKRIDQFQMPLVNRSDLPPDLAQKMCWWVSAAIRDHIVKNFEVDPSVIDDSVEIAVEGALEQEIAAPGDPTEAKRFAKDMAERNRLTEDLLVQILGQGEVSLFEACFAEAADLEFGFARQLLYEPGGDGLAFACKAAGFKRGTFVKLFKLAGKSATRTDPYDARKISKAVEFFDNLDPAHAIAVIKRWRRDPRFLHALDEIESGESRSARGGV